MNHTLLKPIIEATSCKLLAGRIRAIWGVLREFAPYAAIELVLPGGTVLAILCWLYRRRRTPVHCTNQETRTTLPVFLRASI